MTVTDHAPRLFGVSGSSDLVQFHGDVWVGLIASVLVAAAGTELTVSVLTEKWSTTFFVGFAVAGFISVLVTFITNAMGHQYWFFLGVLLPVGEALFCGLIGAQILSTSERPATLAK